ncbi:hypothetical protein EXIGLDRAFT_653817 [Exidia glandulosa HHB12029]|uniref:Condensation domain-containing protein n=1 Tax=Exidia glandulosa HHB12029 TaxID=1314781 RepID=A0A165DYV7_EXIGL|nr:hypothetical protein EXIGLDRAFT_653817 [Exidia glandulosa HHB12029]
MAPKRTDTLKTRNFPMPEPTWTASPGGTYTRPLLGSEALSDGLSLRADGGGEGCMGISFSSTITPTALCDRVRDALLRLRYHSPLIAARLVSADSSQIRWWSYSVASDLSKANEWCLRALKVHHDGPSVEDFVATMSRARLPYREGTDELFFACHLLLRESGPHSLFFHGTHAIMDAAPTLDAFAQMLSWISDPPDGSELSWGHEWVNLPEGPITATGGEGEGQDVEIPKLVRRMEAIASNPKPSESLKPQRREIQDQGASVRVQHCIDAARSSRLIRNVRLSGLSITVLFEAAQALTVFERNHIPSEDEDTAHVTHDFSAISLKKRLVSPQDHFVSAMVLVPIVLHYRDVKLLEGKERLVRAMEIMKEQYDGWKSSAHLPSVALRWAPPSAPNPYAGFFTNIGDIDAIMPKAWPDAERRLIEVSDFVIGHRNSYNTRPLTHLWTFDGKIHLQVQASDMWDAEYLSLFALDVIEHAMLLI